MVVQGLSDERTNTTEPTTITFFDLPDSVIDRILRLAYGDRLDHLLAVAGRVCSHWRRAVYHAATILAMGSDQSLHHVRCCPSTLCLEINTTAATTRLLQQLADSHKGGHASGPWLPCLRRIKVHSVLAPPGAMTGDMLSTLADVAQLYSHRPDFAMDIQLCVPPPPLRPPHQPRLQRHRLCVLRELPALLALRCVTGLELSPAPSEWDWCEIEKGGSIIHATAAGTYYNGAAIQTVGTTAPATPHLPGSDDDARPAAVRLATVLEGAAGLTRLVLGSVSSRDVVHAASSLTGLGSLQLSINSSDICEAGWFPTLAQLAPTLTHLHVTCCPYFVRGEVLQTLLDAVGHLPRLADLSLTGIDLVAPGGNGQPVLANFQPLAAGAMGLRSLQLHGGSASIKREQAMRDVLCPLAGLPQLSEVGLCLFAQRWRFSGTLVLSGCDFRRWVTDESFHIDLPLEP